MQYTIKSGILYDETLTALVKIKSALLGPQRKIFSNTNEILLISDVRYQDASKVSLGDVRNKEYVLTDSENRLLVSACPGYAEGDDPDVVGWPICRMPRVNHAHVAIGKTEYVLTMHNSQNYSLIDVNGLEVLRIMHKGIMGGWRVESSCTIAPKIICGIFVFCRYIEQENEFLVV